MKHELSIRDIPTMVQLVATIEPEMVTGVDRDEGIAVIYRCRAIMAKAEPDDTITVVA